jgi:molybdate transport system substrate-binding protein
MDDAFKAGALKADSRIAVARGGVGMAVAARRHNARCLDTGSLQKTLMAAKSIVVTDPTMPNASGALTQRILSEAGVADALKDKVKVVGLDPGQKTMSKGEYELGFFNISEVRPYVRYAGAVPAPPQKFTNYEAAITAKSAATDLAAAFVRLLTASAERWKQAGMEPQPAAQHPNQRALDSLAQISAFGKLKLANCARHGFRAGLSFEPHGTDRYMSVAAALRQRHSCSSFEAKRLVRLY